MLVVLDTNILIDIEKGFESTISKLTELSSTLPISDPAITWANYYEFYFGVSNTKEATMFLDNFVFLEMTKEATAIFTRLKKQNLQVKDFDLLISSVVIANNALFITKDQDFKKIPGLKYKLL
ncbi:MAG: type II toxin-antitoxin system VapC family toxin [Candidatus Bilamarchaeum sp.]